MTQRNSRLSKRRAKTAVHISRSFASAVRSERESARYFSSTASVTPKIAWLKIARLSLK